MITSTMKRNNIKKILKWTAVALLWLAVWQFASAAANKEILVPYPYAVFLTLKELCITKDFWVAVLYSMLRITSGYLSGIAVGAAGAVLSAKFSVFRAVFSPILHIVRAVPVASFIILALVWIKSAYLAVFISFLMVTPMIWSSVQSGIESIDKRYLEMAHIFKIGPVKTFFQVKLPFLMPSFVAACANALGFAWKSGIAAEVICRPSNSIGRLLQDAKLYLETPTVFALTAVVVLLSLILEIIIKKLAGRYLNDKLK